MKTCPYCNKEMTLGVMRFFRTDIRWQPEGSETGWVNNVLKKGEVMLCTSHAFKGSEIPVYRCDDCEVELIVENDCKSYKKYHKKG